jgi:hypothetical protein
MTSLPRKNYARIPVQLGLPNLMIFNWIHLHD